MHVCMYVCRHKGKVGIDSMVSEQAWRGKEKAPVLKACSHWTWIEMRIRSACSEDRPLITAYFRGHFECSIKTRFHIDVRSRDTNAVRKKHGNPMTDQPALAEGIIVCVREREVSSFNDTLDTGMAPYYSVRDEGYRVVMWYPCHCGGKFFCSIPLNKLSLPTPPLITGCTQLDISAFLKLMIVTEHLSEWECDWGGGGEREREREKKEEKEEEDERLWLNWIWSCHKLTSIKWQCSPSCTLPEPISFPQIITGCCCCLACLLYRGLFLHMKPTIPHHDTHTYTPSLVVWAKFL